jgi:hypothetical protein
MLVANFANEFSNMNGTFTKFDTTLTLKGTWTSDKLSDNSYRKIVANAGNFSEYHRLDKTDWSEAIKGTYTTENPATLTIDQVDTSILNNDPSGKWTDWDDLDPETKNKVGGSKTVMVIIYSDRCETHGVALYKK